MTDQTIAALTSMAAGSAVFAQTSSVDLPLPVSVIATVIGMASTGLVAWGMLKKTSERHGQEIEILRKTLASIHNTVSDVRERVARIEGKLEKHEDR